MIAAIAIGVASLASIVALATWGWSCVSELRAEIDRLWLALEDARDERSPPKEIGQSEGPVDPDGSLSFAAQRRRRW